MLSPWFNREYVKNTKVKILKLQNKDVLIYPDTGAWAVLNVAHFTQYENGTLPQHMAEFLYVRQLLSEKNQGPAEIDFLKPAVKPYVAIINITHHCNLNCDYCFADAQSTYRPDVMSDRVMKSIVKNMNDLYVGLPIIYDIQGGEPLLYKERISTFVSIVKDHSNIPYKFRMTTNGTLITDETIQILKNNNISISISLDGTKKAHNIHRRYHNDKGSFDDVWESIKRLKEKGINFGVVTNLTKYNIKYLDETLQFFSANEISFKPRAVNIFGREVKNKTAPSDSEYFKAYLKMHKMYKQKRSGNSTLKIIENNVMTPVRDYFCMRFPCGAGREVINFNSNGDVYPCDGFKAGKDFKCGNITTKSINEILKHPFIRRLRNRTADKIPKCAICLFRGVCGSCAYSCQGKYNSIYREDPYCSALRKIYLHTMGDWLQRG